MTTATASATIVAVQPGSIAEAAGMVAGDEVLRVNGQVPRDIIEWTLATDDAEVCLDVRRGSTLLEMEITKRPGEPLGVEIHSAVFDRVQTCDNHCEFCFIYQLPKGLRPSLYLKDDDYRLSFLYGNFTTLTRFTEADLERVVSERLSPLNVSIHATDHDLRVRMLRNRRGGMSLRWVAALLEHGIDVRVQIVVCPGVNDADALDATLAGILDRFGGVSSIAVVPLGISRFNTEGAMRPHRVDEARRVVETVEKWQSVYLSVRGRRTVYAADEYYLLAGVDFPARATYGDFEMHEDGIGMARAFEAEFTGQAATTTGPRAGFFAAVDLPSNPAAYTGLRSRTGVAAGGGDAGGAGCGAGHERSEQVSVGIAPGPRAPVAILTSQMGASVLAPLIDGLGRADVRIVAIDNHFFGGTTAVTGLLTGSDISRVLEDQPQRHRYLLPDVCLSADGRFLDDMSVTDLPRPVEIIPTDGTALRRALEAKS